MPSTRHFFPVRDYDLDATLASGQAFRWARHSAAWTGIVGSRHVTLSAAPEGLRAQTAVPVADWAWLGYYLQTGVALDQVLETFPQDEPMQAAVKACRGLRLLRQDPWECLASFILSSTKQIVQIQQIVALVCERYGEPVAVPPGAAPGYSFPAPARLAALSEAELRRCKMGFRAPNLLTAARRVAAGELDLASLGSLSVGEARNTLLELPGVGLKIANCVLLFAYGFPTAFPVDVWVIKALQGLYFPRRRVNLARLQRFAAEHFGPQGGYAQQYLFHYMRSRGRVAFPPDAAAPRRPTAATTTPM
jgi:N-glycosylase/DNA lyase